MKVYYLHLRLGTAGEQWDAELQMCVDRDTRSGWIIGLGQFGLDDREFERSVWVEPSAAPAEVLEFLDGLVPMSPASKP